MLPNLETPHIDHKDCVKRSVHATEVAMEDFYEIGQKWSKTTVFFYLNFKILQRCSTCGCLLILVDYLNRKIKLAISTDRSSLFVSSGDHLVEHTLTLVYARSISDWVNLKWDSIHT